MGTLFRFFWLLLLIFIIFLVVSGCASDKQVINTDTERTVESYYKEAFELLKKEKYSEAAKVFDELERQHPYSSWAAKAELMGAYAYFESEKYDDAILTLDRFIQLHPGHKDIPYAYYLRAICFYQQISDVYRDQKITLLAKDALQEVYRRFPSSKYARDAKIKYDLTVDHLAGKEMAIGRYYLNQGQYLSALNRFREVVLNFQTTNHIEEALYRLVETYTLLGLKADAIRSAAVLGYNYPNGEWYIKAYKLAELDEEKLKKLRAEEEENSWLGMSF